MRPARPNPAPSTAPLPRRLDPVAAWQVLLPRTQEEIGAAAIALAIGVFGTSMTDAQPLEGVPYYVAAMRESAERLHDLVLTFVLRGDATQPPPLPDLRALGIRQCTGCGCTNNQPCAGGCSWIEIDGSRCSACGPEATTGGAPA